VTVNTGITGDSRMSSRGFMARIPTRLLRIGAKTVLTLRTACALDALAAMREAAPTAVVGAGTLTRTQGFTAAERAGAQAAGYSACKLFPAQQAGGVAMLRALAGPLSDCMFCPTGGISRQNAPEFLALPNVPCVGGSWLAPRELLEAKDWSAIEALARDSAGLRPG
jgi:2-dehydro-3-deoxyphosphogluconate aldolase/(4S)-4-hydroxy-2-oxoglutarate aldolase